MKIQPTSTNFNGLKPIRIVPKDEINIMDECIPTRVIKLLREHKLPANIDNEKFDITYVTQPFLDDLQRLGINFTAIA